jgi:hypothetical protein
MYLETYKTSNMINLKKNYKNSVTASSFLQWYFSESDDVTNLGDMALKSLEKEGTFNISVRMLFDTCGFIPQFICEDDDGDNEYEPSQVCFIQD